MKDRLIKISIIFLEIILLYFIFNFNVGCLFKRIFGISCFGCGLTRAFMSILKLDFVSAFRYNIVSIPLFVIVVIFNCLLFVDIILNDNKVSIFIRKILKHYKFILIIIIITTIINNFNGI